MSSNILNVQNHLALYSTQIKTSQPAPTSTSPLNTKNYQHNQMQTGVIRISPSLSLENKGNLTSIKHAPSRDISYLFMVHFTGWLNTNRSLQDPQLKLKSKPLINVFKTFYLSHKYSKNSISTISSYPKQPKCTISTWLVYAGPKTLHPKTSEISKYVIMLSENPSKTRQ